MVAEWPVFQPLLLCLLAAFAVHDSRCSGAPRTMHPEEQTTDYTDYTDGGPKHKLWFDTKHKTTPLSLASEGEISRQLAPVNGHK